MNYENQQLKAYLLGELSAAETENFDELSFTDENFGEALRAAENDLIDAYVNKDADAETREKFEAVYLATAHRREKVEFARALQNYAAKKAVSLKPENEKTGFFALRNFFDSRALSFGFAAALLALFLGVLWFAVSKNSDSGSEIAVQKTPLPSAISTPQNENSSTEIIPLAANNTADGNSTGSNRSIATDINAVENKAVKTPPAAQKPTPAPPPKPVIATFFLAAPLRGTSKIPQFALPPNASRINVELQLDAGDYNSYQVVLANEAGNADLWRGSRLKARNKGENKVLNFALPAKILNDGFYSLRVSGVGEAGEAEIVADYSFRVNKK